MTLMRRAALALLALAARILPLEQRDWARDMQAELHHVVSDTAALNWAVGCVMAGVNRRMTSMLRFNGSISRPVLMLEWLMCFVPLTLAWFAAVRYIVHFGPTADIVVATAFGTLGPIALSMALVTTLSRPRHDFSLMLKFIAGAFLLMVVLQLANAGATHRQNLPWFKYDFSVFFLFSLLPLAGALHLAHLSSRGRTVQLDR